MSPVDIEGTLEEDRRNNRQIPRFGVKVKTEFTLKDGNFYEIADLVVWKILIESPGATSLNFQFTDLKLPEGSKMYIRDKYNYMLIGPIEPSHTHNGKFASDIVLGDEVVIEVFLKKGNESNFSIKVNNVIHGFKEEEITPRGYGDSEPCNNNVNCSVGSAYANEKDAVALILVGGVEHCSGSLLYNDCYRAFFLTAFHCLDNGDDTLTLAEQNAVDNWVFRFQYESPTCTDAVPTSYLSFSGADFRAAWNTTDFALLELQEQVNGFSQIAFAGWNRQAAPPDANVASIHHPQGDIKKISLDDEDLDEDASGNFWLIDQWDDGLLEPGSSGGPLFDENRRVVGQVNAALLGINTINCNGTGGSDVSDYTYGKFDISWTGGGTNTTRLSNWLGGATTTNTVRAPFAQGADLLCTSNSTYTVQNNISGSTVSWAVSPTSLFGTPTSGTGTSASIRAASSFSSGLGAITFTISISGCSAITISKSMWVGKPFLTLYGTSTVYTGEDGDVYTSFTSPLQGVTSVAWSYTGPLNSISGGVDKAKYYAGYTTGTGNIYANASNACGSYEAYMPYEVVSGLLAPPVALNVYPNPTKEWMNIDLINFPKNKIPVDGLPILLYDKFGKLLLRKTITTSNNSLNVQNLQSDVYFLEFTIDDKKQYQKVMILK